MSLYGALNAGASALKANASAMSAISDNIANTNTIGYKATDVQFKTLVTRQSSATQYSAGGIQARPYQSISQQGLMSSTSSNTDLAIDGDGMFIVASSSDPDINSTYSYTRAGSMRVDKDGYLRNTAGSYLLGWPLMNDDGAPQASTIDVNGSSYMKAFKNPDGKTQYVNDSVIDNQNLKPLNTANLAGNAVATTRIEWRGFTLPASGGKSFNYSPQVVDTLGAEHSLQTYFYKTGPNQWEEEQVPPLGAARLTTGPSVGNEIYGSMGRLDFTDIPADGSVMDITVKGKSITFHYGDFGTHQDASGHKVVNPADGKITANGSGGLDVNIDVVGVQNLSEIVDSVSEKLNAIFEYGPNHKKTMGNPGFGMNAADLTVLNNKRISEGKDPVNSTDESMDDPDYFAVNNNGLGWGIQREATPSLNPVKWVDTRTENSVQSIVIQQNCGDNINIDLTNVVAAAGGANKPRVSQPNTDPMLVVAQNDMNVALKTKTAADRDKTTKDRLAATAKVNLAKANSAVTNAVKAKTQADTLVKTTTADNTKAQAAKTAAQAAVTAAQALVAAGTAAGATPAQVTAGKAAALTMPKLTQDLANATAAATMALSAMNSAVKAQGVAVTQVTTANAAVPAAQTALANANAAANNADAVALAADADYAVKAGKVAKFPKFTLATDQAAAEKNIIPITEGGESATMQGSQLDNHVSPAAPLTSFSIDGLSDKYLIQKSPGATSAPDIGMRNRGVPAIEFDNGGHPKRFFGYDKNVQADPSSKTKIDWANGSEDMGYGEQSAIKQKLGSYGAGDGISQQGTEYNAGNTPQNGASFGFMTGINIGADGTVIATYSNGTTRPIFQIPLATFTNENQMASKSGNMWNETDDSGRPTLRTAATARAGGIQGNALETSTADIATEFTKMIKIQRAYSASTKIVTTTDSMLQELVSLKR